MSHRQSQLAASSAQRAQRLESLSSGVVMMLALTIVQRGIGFLRSVLFCRWLEPDQLGEADLAFNFLMLAAPLAVLGLPGCFGRYVDHFRQREQLRSFLTKITVASLALACAASGVLWVLREPIGHWVFGRSNSGSLITLLALSLGVVIAFNFVNSLLNALRMYRANACLQLSQTLLYALVSLGLFYWWRPGPESVVVGFAIAAFITTAAAAIALRQLWRELPTPPEALRYPTLVVKLAPFAFWLWVTNWAANSFELVDRWMIVHYSGLEPLAALTLVGQYHSAKVLPVLLIGVGDLLSNMLTPHLSADWESGRQERVGERLQFTLKLAALGFTLAAIAILGLSPVLFHTAFNHKFAGGEAILAWMLCCAVWTALTTIACNYLWCAEKSRWVSFTFIVGLTISAACNLALLPHFGLLGAAWSTTIAKAASFALMIALMRYFGLRIDPRLGGILLAPLALPWGGMVTLLVLGVVVVGLGPYRGCFTNAERLQLRTCVEQLVQRIPRLRRSMPA